MSFPITPSNIKKLTALSQMPLRIDRSNEIGKQDLFNIINQSLSIYQPIGQYSQFTLGAISSTPYYLSLVNVPSAKYISWNLRARFQLTDSSGNTFDGNYCFNINSSNAATSITMTGNNTGGSLTGVLSLFPDFVFFGTGDYKDFGIKINTDFTALSTNYITLYLDAPTQYDIAGSQDIPTLATAQNTMLGTLQLSIATNNGTNWYSWATTSTNAGGTTTGYV